MSKQLAQVCYCRIVAGPGCNAGPPGPILSALTTVSIDRINIQHCQTDTAKVRQRIPAVLRLKLQ